ncbi:MAG: hypothetical protein KatS3mg057_1215 [Herpetosiphonaceae bacterium]|nr:MAG: hypothetical protein KatS3mg057_1215 [Herpetosiphonaceae bacterium]
MTNRDIAIILFNIAVLLKRQAGNPYRIRAYRRAAQRILRLRHSLAERVARGAPLGVPGLGRSLSAKITELVTTGRMSFYDELCEGLPARERALMQVEGIGPILAERISRELGDADLSTLVREAAEVRLQQIWGIGPRRAAAIVSAVLPHDDLPPTDDVSLPVPQQEKVVYVQESLFAPREIRRAA